MFQPTEVLGSSHTASCHTNAAEYVYVGRAMAGCCTAPFGDSGACTSQVIERQGFRQSCDSRNVNSIFVDLRNLLYPGGVVWNHGLGMPRVWFFFFDMKARRIRVGVQWRGFSRCKEQTSNQMG